MSNAEQTYGTYGMPQHIDADSLQVMIGKDNRRTLFAIITNPFTGMPIAVGYHFNSDEECRTVALHLVTPYDDVTPDMTMPPAF